MSKKRKKQTRLFNIIIGAVFVLVGGGAGGLILYEVTDNLLFKRISVICFLPLLLAFFVGFFGKFLIVFILALIPGLKLKESSIFYQENLPWWGAFIWLIVLSVFIIGIVPTILDNILINLGIFQGEITSVSSNIDQSTILGMFKAWVIGERTLINSIVFWSIIAVGVGVLTGIGRVVKKVLWNSMRKPKC